jgi:hypothetical protein
MMAVGLAFVLSCAEAAEKPKVAANAPAGTPANVPKDTHGDDAPRISLADAKKEFDAGSAVFLDTRGAENYRLEHVKGALNFTTADLAKADTLPKGKKIIVYCS